MTRPRRIRGTSPEVELAAREMRWVPTPAEDALWEVLRSGGLAGLKFRRQHPLGRFILDFYCASQRLCIEVDGPVHERRREQDAARDAYLSATGIRVLRFTNDQVLHRRATVLARIREAAEAP